jgi:hypothetical protein
MQSIVANCNAVVVALYGQAGPTFKEFSLLILPRFKEINQSKSYFSSGPSYLMSYSFPETAVGGEIAGILAFQIHSKLSWNWLTGYLQTFDFIG